MMTKKLKEMSCSLKSKAPGSVSVLLTDKITKMSAKIMFVNNCNNRDKLGLESRSEIVPAANWHIVINLIVWLSVSHNSSLPE